ncbi:MAG: T9SS type A sorting domain-containing protein [Saprospiraceae bacterium]|jgi:hypothetical protein
MKNYYFLFFILGLSVGLFAQDVQLSPNPNITINNSSSVPFEVVGYGTVANNGTETVTLHWVREYVEGPQEWTSLVCDINLCYAPVVGSQTFSLEPGQSGNLDVHLRPASTQGCGSFNMYLLSEDQNDTLAVGEYLFQVGDNPGCDVAVSTNWISRDMNIHLAPNPMTSFFTLQGTDDRVQSVQIFNLVGAPVRTFENGIRNQYSVEGLTPGMYLVQIKDEEGNTLKTVRMVKN